MRRRPDFIHDTNTDIFLVNLSNINPWFMTKLFTIALYWGNNHGNQSSRISYKQRYICKTQIRIRPQIVSNHYVILRSMSFQGPVPSNMCPLMSHPDQCAFKNKSPQIREHWRHTQIKVLQNICSQTKVICQNKYPQKCGSSTFWT